MDALIVAESKNGKAVFANKDFKKGEELIQFKGKLFTYKELPTPYDEVEDHYVQIDKDLYLGPSGGLDDFFNHSCNPNSGMKIIGKKVILTAIRNIKKGEEITWDYSTTMNEDSWELDCMCESKNCRKKIRDFKYLPKETQQKYIKLEIVPKYILENLKQMVFEIPKEGKMNVPGRIYASEKLMESIKQDKTIEQVRNVACLPGILKASIALADSHQGYGFSIGGVAAFDMDKGIISPGGVGYDINCSCRLLKTNLKKEDVEKKKKEIVEAIYRKIPSGLGKGSKFNLSRQELNKILESGAKYMVEKGYGIKDDYIHMEEEGCIKKADAGKVSETAIKRGIGQLGTLGSGNHFLEVQYVDEIFDKEIAKVFGLEKNQVTIMIHCGSRGLGHQVASDYIKKMEDKYGFKDLPDRELINAPIKSPLGKDYFSAMACAANFAFANKQLITHWIREEMKDIFPKVEIDVVYDVCHNIAKFEEHFVDGKKQMVCVHRKGATRSFGAGREEIPEDYRKVGQPVIIPGSMGTSSYVLVGTKKAEELTFGSTVHGAGRVSSRSKALRELRGEDIKEELNAKGIEVMAGSWKSLAEEAPEVYKDIDEVVNVVDELGISKKVARLKPLVVIKG